MKKALAISALPLAALAFVVATRSPAAAAPPQDPACDNTLLHEPIVMFEVSGSTLVEQIHQTLTVFSDGSATLSQTTTEGSGRVSVAHTTPLVVANLSTDLALNGAGSLCDDTRTVTDVPLRTVTFFRGDQDARAHTFSYWTGEREYANVDAALEKFIDAHF